MTPIQQLTDAISERRIVSFMYDDKKRLVEPHCLGMGSRGALLRAFQVTGQSATDRTAWKLFTVDKIQDLRVEPHLLFDEPREGYKKGDPVMSGGIIAEL